MRITILTGGTRGDVQPYVGLGLGLRRAGHQVRMPASEIFRTLITGAGLEFMPIKEFDGLFNPQNPQELQAYIRGSNRHVVQAILATARMARLYLANLLDTYWSASEDADLLVASTTAFGVLDCAEKRGIKYIYAPQQPFSPTRSFPNVILSPYGIRLNCIFNRFTYYLLFGCIWLLFRKALNKWRWKMGLSPHSVRSYWRWFQAQINICGFSPSILPGPVDWPSNHHVTGYWFLDKPPDWQPPPGLVRFLENGPAPIYIGFGSMSDGDPSRMTQLVLEALKISNKRGVLLSGWGGLSKFSLPKTVYWLDNIPHDWLFPRMAAVVHHGGMGTTAAGFRAGVPSVIIPFIFDQPNWGKYVEQLGLGICCPSLSKITTVQLAAALTKVTTDTSMRERCDAMGEKIRSEDGIGKAVGLIQDYLTVKGCGE